MNDPRNRAEFVSGSVKRDDVGLVLPCLAGHADFRNASANRRWRHRDITALENDMASDMASSDTKWVEDVRRWVAAQARSRDDADAAQLGYEAADPVLQARHWPDAIGSRDPFDGA